MMVAMTLPTPFTDLLGIEHPVALAPMGGASGGALAAAVSEAGGLGIVGCGRETGDWLDRELAIAAAGTSRPWGAGFQTWATGPATIERALGFGPAAVMLSFGDLTALAALVRSAGVRLIVQVTDLTEARQAIDAGADVIVAQGTEAGGHGGKRSTLPFVPVVADLAQPVPVLAAGGIADGRGLAAALALGAAGALVGTRFLVAHEALVPPWVPKAIMDSGGEDTVRSRVSDIARGSAWPARYGARTIRTPFLDDLVAREQSLADDEEAQAAARLAYQAAVAAGSLTPEPVWASEAIDLITGPSSAAEIVTDLVAGAQLALARIRVR